MTTNLPDRCLCSWTHRYNVSCSQHYKSSRGRAAGLVPPPTPTESGARRRGPTRRSSSNSACNKMSTRHLSVKVRPSGFSVSQQIGRWVFFSEADLLYLLAVVHSVTLSPVARRTFLVTATARRTTLPRCPRAPHTPAPEPDTALLSPTARPPVASH